MDGWPTLIRRLFSESGLSTRQEFAARIGVTPTTLSNWWHGHQVPRGKSLKALAGATGHTPSTLVRMAMHEGGDDKHGELVRLCIERLQQMSRVELAEVLVSLEQRIAGRTAVPSQKGGAA